MSFAFAGFVLLNDYMLISGYKIGAKDADTATQQNLSRGGDR